MTLAEAKRNGVERVRLARWLPGTYLTVPRSGDPSDHVYVTPPIAAMEIRGTSEGDSLRGDWIPVDAGG